MNNTDLNRHILVKCCYKLAAILIVSASTICAAASVLSEARPWAFVTAVGGLEIGRPVQLDQRWQLPVHADVSGLHAITKSPTTMNSGLVCASTKARVEGRNVFIVIVTSAPHDNASSSCPAADLGSLAPGKYNVLYGSNQADGVRLGTIDVAH